MSDVVEVPFYIGENIVGVLILIANLGVFGMTLKLYTEYFKDRSQSERKKTGP